MRVCLIYDCVFPWTIGGAERWYRALGERLAARGHEVTYLTLRQWDRGDEPAISGIKVIVVGPRMELYVDGRRRITPPLRFGLGVLAHLARNGGRYDHVHLASFPFFSLLAAGLVRPFRRYSLGVDWHEVWSFQYWREYLGAGGVIGWLVQQLCIAVPQRAFAFSRLHLARLAALGREGTLLPGEYAGGDRPQRSLTLPPTVVYAGRLIPEKRVDLLVEAFALVRARRPDLRLRILGQGPEHDRVAAAIAAHHLAGSVTLGGFLAQEQLDSAMGEALAVVQPSQREGYGMVVVEASARGVPAIVTKGPDNAAIELVDAGENGLVVAPTAAALAEAILTIADNNLGWRQSTAAWYARNRERLSVDYSLDLVIAAIGA
jgi:glycosyltransferase involved in cell wall biosynthesis